MSLLNLLDLYRNSVFTRLQTPFKNQSVCVSVCVCLDVLQVEYVCYRHNFSHRVLVCLHVSMSDRQNKRNKRRGEGVGKEEKNRKVMKES